jgi:nucleoside-diphosphate kinase
MNGYQTLTIIKPHAVSDNNACAILDFINKAGFTISALKMTRLSVAQAEYFYQEHNGKDFFQNLINMMSSGPIIVAIIEKENAVSDFRKLIGNTDPEKAEAGTIRKLYARSMRENAIHASDSDQNALRECRFFFSELEQFKTKSDQSITN